MEIIDHLLDRLELRDRSVPVRTGEVGSEMRITRRTFLKYTGGTVLTWYAFDKLGVIKAIAQIPGGTLDPGLIPKFQTPLLIPPVMPKAGRIVARGGKNIDYYEISMKQFNQQILPALLPATTVWGYGAVSSESKRGLLVHNAPSLTIEAKWNTPVRVKWINDLKNANNEFLPHLLPVDQTLHWANPPGGTLGRDTRPTFTSTPGRYNGPVPMVTHVHGAIGVGDESDGYAEAWYLPPANDIPIGYASEGTWYNFFKSKAATSFDATWGSGFAVFQYPNENRASTIWYHDHALGMTRLNVYAGPAGFYIIRGGPDGDDAVVDRRLARRPSCRDLLPMRTTNSPPIRPTTRFRLQSRIDPLTLMVPCSIRTLVNSSTDSRGLSFLIPIFLRFGIPNSLGT